MQWLWYILIAVVCLAAGSAVGYFYRKNEAEKKIGRTEQYAQRLLDDATRKADEQKKEMLLAAKEEVLHLKSEADKLLADLKGVGTVLTITAGQATSTTPTWSARPLPRTMPTPWTPPGQWAPPARTAPLVHIDTIEATDPTRVGNDLITHVGDAVAVTGLDRLVI